MRCVSIKRELQMTEIYALIVCKLACDAVVFNLEFIANTHFDYCEIIKHLQLDFDTNFGHNVDPNQ